MGREPTIASPAKDCASARLAQRRRGIITNSTGLAISKSLGLYIDCSPVNLGVDSNHLKVCADLTSRQRCLRVVRAIDRREQSVRKDQSPVGTAELSLSAVPAGLIHIFDFLPGDSSPGYFERSLRDKLSASDKFK